MIKTIIFDFDGVIVESVDIKTKAFARLFENEGPKIVEQVVDYHLTNCGMSRFEKFKYIYKNMLKKELNEETFDFLCRRFSELVMEEVIKAPYVPGAKEFLDEYSGVYKCFVASGTPQNEMEEIVTRRGMSKYFVKVYGSPKTKEDIVRQILKDYESSNTESVFIGDASSDYEGAMRNKVRFIARIFNNENIFRGVDCEKVADLKGLREILSK